jgi:integrase
MKRVRGVYENVPGSGVWRIRYADASSRIRREKTGTKGAALKLYRKRKTEALQGKKLPETLRSRAVTFRELIADALEHAKAHCSLFRVYESRAELLVSWFGDRAAESITPQEFDRRLDEVMRERGWRPATVNRHKSLVSLAYSLGMRNGKVETNPARLVRARREDNGRIRFLSDDEELRLRPLIPARHLPEFYIALNTGMRLSEQYGRLVIVSAWIARCLRSHAARTGVCGTFL